MTSFCRKLVNLTRHQSARVKIKIKTSKRSGKSSETCFKQFTIIPSSPIYSQDLCVGVQGRARWGGVVNTRYWIRGGARLALLSSSTVLWDTFCSNRFFHFYPILLLETIQNPPSLEPIITAIRMSGHVYIGRTHIQIFHLAAPAPIHLK